MVSGAGRSVTRRSFARPGSGPRTLRVQPVGDLARRGLDLPVTQRRQPRPELGVREGRSAGSRHAVSRATIVARHSLDVPGPQRRHRVRQLRGQRLRQPHVPGRRGAASPAGPARPARRSPGPPCRPSPPPPAGPARWEARSPRSPPPAPPQPPPSTAPTAPAARPAPRHRPAGPARQPGDPAPQHSAVSGAGSGTASADSSPPASSPNTAFEPHQIGHRPDKTFPPESGDQDRRAARRSPGTDDRARSSALAAVVPGC